MKTKCQLLRGKLDLKNGDNMETYWRQNGNKNEDKPWRQTWRQQWREMETKLRQNVHFYEVKFRQNIDKIEPKPDNYEIYINPRIDKTNEKSTQQGSEGCLSIPGISLIIERYDEIDIRYYNIDGKKQKKSLAGFLSRLFQHELDHLNGKLMFEDPISNILLDNSVTLESKYIYQIQKLIKYTIGK